MKLDCVLTAVNEDPLYLDFVPIFIRTWHKLYPDVDVRIVLVAKSIRDDLLPYKDNILLFEPLDGILTSFVSQFVRLLYPCILNYDNGVVITDIDMLPMSRSYYTESIAPYDNSKFIYYRGDCCMDLREFAMCYNVATPRVWRDVFGMSSLEDIRRRLVWVSKRAAILPGHGSQGWNTDQRVLYSVVMDWNVKRGNLVRLDDTRTGFRRLDRGTFDIRDKQIQKRIANGAYTDYHACRPMSEFREVNYAVYDLL